MQPDSGQRLVATSGSPVTLTPSSLPCDRVDIQALFTNSGKIFVGGPSVSASTPNGVGLQAGDVYNIEYPTDLLSIWLDTTVNGNGVSYTWWRGKIN